MHSYVFKVDDNYLHKLYIICTYEIIYNQQLKLLSNNEHQISKIYNSV
jgi:hypothetical protein